LDLYPTLVELCGFDMPAHVQGTSLVRNLEDSMSYTREAAFSLYPHGRNDKDKLVIGYAVRTDRYRYVRWINLSEELLEAEELYDHHTDPGENINAAGSDQYGEDKAQLAGLLGKRWKMNKSVLNHKYHE
jgi:iduronate 2-sulfatase